MTYRKKNLLEAFQASAAAEKAKAPERSPAAAPKVGGPFARPAPASPTPPAEPESASAARPRAAWRVGWRSDGLQRLILLQLVITVAAFFLGRASVKSVDASEPRGGAEETTASGPASPTAGDAGASQQSASQQAASQQSSPAARSPQVQVDPEPGTPAERALLDPRNLYTVTLVEYRARRDEALALATLQYLLDQGLPAVAKVKGERLFILLGAAPTQKELDGLLATARTMTGPPPLDKPAEFHDAYVSGIDRLGIR